MVTGALGVPGGAALKHVGLEQEQDLGAAITRLQSMEGDPAVDQAACQELATQELVQVNVNTIKIQRKGRLKGEGGLDNYT